MAELESEPQWVLPTPGDTVDEGRSFAAVARALFQTAPAAPRVGRYYLLERIGQGGMGVVYVGYDPTLERQVAIKFLKDRKRGGDRLLGEGRALANLVHPNVVAVHEVAEDDGGVYLVMAHIEGHTLDAWLSEEPRGWREILRVLVDAGRGLAAVHDAGLAHRDVKPSNLLIDAHGQVRVADFGLAVRVEPGGVRVKGGTEAYMAPEQAEGERVGPAADQYALCVCLLEALVGERMIDAQPSDWRRVATARDPDGEAPPPRVFEAIARGLQPDPRARHPSMAALLEALDPHEATPRHPATWLAGGLVVGMLGLAVGLAVAPEPEVPAESPPPCAGLEETFLRTHWAPPHREGVVTVERARDPMWSVTLGSLDAYARRWDGVLMDGCVAHADGSLSPVGLDDRNRCLDRLGRDFDVLVGLLRDEPAVVGSEANRAVASLRDPSSCELPRSVLELTVPGYEATPSEPTQSLERDLAEQWARYRLGLEPEPVAKTFERRAGEVEDSALRADTYRYLAETAGEHEDKDRLVDLAVRSALQGRAYVMLAAALIDQGRMREWRGMLDEAAERFDLAEAATVAVEELSEDFPALEVDVQGLRGQLRLARGNLARRQGDFVAHLEHQQAALRHFMAVGTARPLAQATAWTNVGEAHRLLGQSVEAEQAYSRAIELARPLLQRDSLDLQTMYNNRGSARQDGGDWKGARGDYARVLPSAGPLETSAQAMAAFNIALMDAQRGDPTAAAERCAEALAVIAPDGPAPFPGMASLFELSCSSFEALAADTAPPMDAMLDAYAELERVLGGDKSLMVLAQMEMARTMLHAGRLQDAAVWIERARSSCADLDTPDSGSVEILAGRLAAASGRASDARAAYQRGVDVFEGRGLAEHPLLVEPLLALAAFAEGAEAEALRVRAEKIARRQDMGSEKG